MTAARAWRSSRSILFLITKNFKFDALAVAVTEVGLAFLAANLVTGSIWGRIIWGIWWAWDARLTSALVCWLLYAGYLMLRHAIEEPTQRATFAAVFSIFAFIDVPIVIFSIKWWRTQHPAARLLGRRQFPAGLEPRLPVADARDGAARRRDDRRPPAPGRIPARNRFPAPHGACLLTEISMPLFLLQTADDVAREIARLQHNYEFLSYGLIAAWVILVIYVMMMLGRQKRLKREISNLRAMLDDKR